MKLSFLQLPPLALAGYVAFTMTSQPDGSDALSQELAELQVVLVIALGYLGMQIASFGVRVLRMLGGSSPESA